MILHRLTRLGVVPKGRDENPDQTMKWVRHHDRYEEELKTPSSSRGSEKDHL
jgi:predicted dithiol-disulfide oxidoreductase (DUF899 family)